MIGKQSPTGKEPVNESFRRVKITGTARVEIFENYRLRLHPSMVPSAIAEDGSSEKIRAVFMVWK